jgi:hypothetical protein
VKAQEQVVTTGFTRLSNGTRVRVQAGEGESPDAAPNAPPQKSEGAPQASEGAPTERRRKRDGGGSVENTDGKQWRKRSETAPATPSVKQ